MIHVFCNKYCYVDKQPRARRMSHRGAGPGLHPAGRRVHRAAARRPRHAGHRSQLTQLH